jgi:putative ATPase
MKKEPLAFRLCPKTLEEFVGQEEVLGKNKRLRRMIETEKLSSIILYGPPGSGKTSIAKIISTQTKISFKRINAVSSGVSDIKKIVEDTQNLFFNPMGKTILFIDEIHRFNKAQQDALLPFVEDGTIVLIGATTENPYFEVNKALISRSTVFVLKQLTTENILNILKNALQDQERGLGDFNIELEESTLQFIAELSSGDARVALNTLEGLISTSKFRENGKIVIEMSDLEDFLQNKVISYDKNSDNHYDTISAFIKSMRGSDPNAAVFYLAKALQSGEDPIYLARRMIICASEDVGLANPSALTLATSALDGVKAVGMPEARIILAQAAIGIATSPKSNASYLAINKAMEDVQTKYIDEIPMHLRNAPHAGLKSLGYGKGYKYPHDYEEGYVQQEYLPQAIHNTVYYHPTNRGEEKNILQFLENLKKG